MKNIVKTGEIVLLSQGEYSDYSVTAIVRATQDFDLDELSTEYLALYPDQAVRYQADLYKFQAWLTNDKKLVEDIDYREVHLGDYELEPTVR